MPEPRRVAAAAAALLLLLGGTAACGGESDDYCTSFLDTRQELNDLAAQQSKQKGSVDVLTPSLAAFEKLRSQAPEQLRDEWDTVVFAYQDLADAVASSGVDPKEFTVGKVPEGLAPKDKRALARVAAKLGSPRVLQAVAGLEDHAAQVCEDAPTDEAS